MWGIAGNEIVDKIAKKAARGTAEFICIPHQDWFRTLGEKPTRGGQELAWEKKSILYN